MDEWMDLNVGGVSLDASRAIHVRNSELTILLFVNKKNMN